MTNQFDLNLLRLLVAVADAGSVSGAAVVLGMTQPGVSTALARARRQLGDDLFVYTDNSMQPTPRARRAIEAARGVIDIVQHSVLEQPTFDPAHWQGQIRAAMQDVSEAFFLPALLELLQLKAPGTTVHCIDSNGPALRAALSEGAIDLAIGYFPDLDLQPFTRQRLYLHTYACIVRPGHPVVARGLDLASFCSLGHVVNARPGHVVSGFMRTLASRHIERRVVVDVPHILSIPAIIEATDYIATVPLAVAEYFARDGRLAVLPLPFPPARFEVFQYWHRSFQRDPRNTWMRRQISDLFNDRTDRWRKFEELLYGNREPRRAGAEPPTRQPRKLAAKGRPRSN